MKILLLILFLGIFKNLFGLCESDDRTLTEMLFKGQVGTIFSCKILTMTIPKYDNDVIVWQEDGIDGTSTAEIIQVYFGKVDTNIVILRTGSYFQIGKTYLIYTSGNGRKFGYGGNCDKWTKLISDNPDLTYEVKLLKQFSDIFKSKISGKYIFTNSKGIILADGQYKKGKPIKIWKHYFENGFIKTEYDLKNNITTVYSDNGFITGKASIKKNIGIHEKYSTTLKGVLEFKTIDTKNDTGFVTKWYNYYSNGNLKNVSEIVYITYKHSCSSAGKTGVYEEYYENGKLKLKGQYDHNRRVGLWIWFENNGEVKGEFDYKDGANGKE